MEIYLKPLLSDGTIKGKQFETFTNQWKFVKDILNQILL